MRIILKYKEIQKEIIVSLLNETIKYMLLFNINIQSQSLFKSTSYTMSFVVSASVLVALISRE